MALTKSTLFLSALPSLIVLAACDNEATCPEGSNLVHGICTDPAEAGVGEGGTSDARDGAMPTGSKGDAAVTEGGAPDDEMNDGGVVGEGGVRGSDADNEGAGPGGGGGAVCYLDYDHDGFGSGEPLGCPASLLEGAAEDAGEQADEDKPAIVLDGGDCDDSDPATHPGAEEFCDEVDTDCDGELDNDALNACGGACDAVLDGQPGAPCDNGQLGYCARQGIYVCQGTDAVYCTAGAVQPGNEICGDGIDNDCDGAADEATAVNAKTWYQDCDDDGYAQSTLGTLQSCERPTTTTCDNWVDVKPVAGSTWDCNDDDDRYGPEKNSFRYAPSGVTEFDFNCDYEVEFESRYTLVSVFSGIEGSPTSTERKPACSNSQIQKLQQNECIATDCVAFFVNNAVTATPPNVCRATELNRTRLLRFTRSNGDYCPVLSNAAAAPSGWTLGRKCR